MRVFFEERAFLIWVGPSSPTLPLAELRSHLPPAPQPPMGTVGGRRAPELGAAPGCLVDFKAHCLSGCVWGRGSQGARGECPCHCALYPRPRGWDAWVLGSNSCPHCHPELDPSIDRHQCSRRPTAPSPTSASTAP